MKGSPPNDAPQVAGLESRDTPALKPYLGELHICYLVDKGPSYEYIQNRHLEEDGLTLEELHQIGLRNLRQLVAERNSRVQPYGNVFTFLMGGDFEAGLMLLDEFWNGEFRKFIKGEYALVVPARDVLAFCDAQSRDGLIELQQVIDRVWPKGDHLLSKKIYIRQNNAWYERI